MQSSFYCTSLMLKRGAKAHKPSKDPNETQDVITLAFYSARGTRIGSAHAREDGTYTFQASRQVAR
jgi:hypothetical protein